MMPADDARVTNRPHITLRQGRKGRVTAWLVECSECGVDRVAPSKKMQAARQADQHNRETHQGVFIILAPRGEQ